MNGSGHGLGLACSCASSNGQNLVVVLFFRRVLGSVFTSGIGLLATEGFGDRVGAGFQKQLVFSAITAVL